jgi:tetratricopeptide (TPR) repeat protein
VEISAGSVQVRLLGQVGIRRDGEPVLLRPKEATALAALLAARGQPVFKDTLADWIWPDGAGYDGVPKLIWRLRECLSGSGLDIPDARQNGGRYRITGDSETTWAEVIDAYRFESLVRSADEMFSAGADDEALRALREAAAAWHGLPFDSPTPGPLPPPCLRQRSRLERARADLIRRVAEIALRRGGDYAAADVYRERPVGADAERVDAAWLVAFLSRLGARASDRAGADMDLQERAAARSRSGRRPGAAGSSLTTDVLGRARDLLMLRDSGVDVHEPLAVAQREPDAGRPAELADRDRESAVLDTVLAAVQTGRPARLTLRGGSSSGQPRLAEELGVKAAAAGVPMILASCRESDDFGPWRYVAGTLWANCCRNLASDRDPLTPAERAALAELTSGQGTRPDRQQPEVASGIVALAVHAARLGRGLFVGLDDVDQLTERGADILRRVLAGLSSAPVGWLLTGPDGKAGSVLPEPGAGTVVVNLALPPLGVSSPASTSSTSTGPASLSEEEASSAAKPDPRRWVSAAAITAAELRIDTRLVAEMLGLDDDEADRQQAAAIGPWRIDTASGVRFRHAKSRTAALAMLDADPALRRFLHRRAMTLLSGRSHAAGDRDPALAVRIAEHALGADRSLTAADAAGAYLAAARAELACLAADSAVTWARYGLERPLPDDAATRCGLHLVLGDALDALGAVHEADAEYRLAYDGADQQPLLRAEAAIAMARRWSDPGRLNNELLPVLRAILAELAAAPDPAAGALRLQLTAHLARKLTMAVPAQDAADSGLAQDGVALARELLPLPATVTPQVRCEVLIECRWALFDYEPPVVTMRLSTELQQASATARAPYFEGQALVALAVDQLRLGRVSQAEGTIDKHARSLAGYGHHAHWIQSTLDTLLDLWHGRYEQAGQRLFGEAARALEQARGDRAGTADTLQQTWQGQVFWLLRERGQMDLLLESDAGTQIERHVHFPVWRAAMILACTDTGRFDEAADRLAALAHDTDDFASFPPHGWTPSVTALIAEALLALSQARSGPGVLRPHPLTSRVRDILARYHGEFVLGGWPTVLAGPAIRYSGLLATAAGDYDEAIRLFDTALPQVGDARPQVLRLRLDKARALLGRGDGAAATALLTQVMNDADGLGMVIAVTEARRLLAKRPD